MVDTESFTRDLLAKEARRFGYEIGEFTYGHPAVWNWGDGQLEIGRFCSIASQVEIILAGAGHDPRRPTTYPLQGFIEGISGPPLTLKVPPKVAIGNDVWLGHGCTILAPAIIGDGAVIAARAVVKKDVEPYAVVGGNPAKPIRKRFTDEQIAALLRIRWWDWPVERVKQMAPLLLAPDIEAFISTAGSS